MKPPQVFFVDFSKLLLTFHQQNGEKFLYQTNSSLLIPTRYKTIIVTTEFIDKQNLSFESKSQVKIKKSFLSKLFFIRNSFSAKMNDNNRDQRFLRTYERTTTLNTTTTKTPVYYRSSIGSRSTIIQPARNWSLPNRYAGFPTLPVGLRQISQANAKLANPVNSNRERERRDLVDLNNRFAQYIEKIRLLEAQNKKLDHEINALRSRSSK